MARRRRGDHVGASSLRDLDGRRADAARAAVDQHSLPGLHVRDCDHRSPRGLSDDWHSRRLLEGHFLRLGGHSRDGRNRVFHIGAAGRDRDHSLSDLPRTSLICDRIDDTREISARNDFRPRSSPSDDFPVHRVHRDGSNLDADLTGLWVRPGDGLELHLAVDHDDGAHGFRGAGGDTEQRQEDCRHQSSHDLPLHHQPVPAFQYGTLPDLG